MGEAPADIVLASRGFGRRRPLTRELRHTHLIDLAGVTDEGKDIPADPVGGSFRAFQRAAGNGDA